MRPRFGKLKWTAASLFAGCAALFVCGMVSGCCRPPQYVETSWEHDNLQITAYNFPQPVVIEGLESRRERKEGWPDSRTTFPIPKTISEDGKIVLNRDEFQHLKWFDSKHQPAAIPWEKGYGRGVAIYHFASVSD